MFFFSFNLNSECSAAAKGARLIAAAIIWMRGFNQESTTTKNVFSTPNSSCSWQRFLTIFIICIIYNICFEIN